MVINANDISRSSALVERSRPGAARRRRRPCRRTARTDPSPW